MTPSIFVRQPLSLRKTAIVLIIALILMWFDSKNPEWFQPVRNISHAAMQPIYELSLLPSYAQHWASDSMQSKETLRRENVRLKSQVIHAQAKLQQQDYILAQNARLQGILSTTKPEQFELNLAQVIGTDTSLLKQIVVLNKGAQDGVEVGQTVIDEDGILGQIINVYPNTSRLLLITDEQQSVAVTVKRTGQRAIVTGEGIPTSLRLNYVFKTSDVRVGDELISSGLGGRIPAGYRVGRITYINDTQADNFRTIKVSPAANFVDNSYVLILQDKTVSADSELSSLMSTDKTSTDTTSTDIVTIAPRLHSAG
ncbi:rod shape-determining protein MreC [Psychrobacter sp. PL15]|uniref:rod shape-determining protein MreC n=1 Tax=unclassified Psychrobacter TaxID=196806 RepID=UPI001AE5A7E5|nr:rod shape-determining protein MreC [Psychrobacter sp. PL15]MEC5211071.1 rod shape-determining protein MreC [Psychrobacter sp. PL15]